MITITADAREAKPATLDQPLDHLMACHRRIEQRLDTLERVSPLLWERRDEALQAIRNACAFLDSNGAIHTEDEEQSVFPRLQGKLTMEQAELVRSLESDHQTAHRIYAELLAVADRIRAAPAPDETLRSRYSTTVARFCELYRRHIELEDSKLMEIARGLLTPIELAEISAEMKQRRGRTTSEAP